VVIVRPVKMHMSLWDNAKAIGKRFPYYVKYHAGFDHSGKLLGIKMDIYGNLGAQKNDSPLKHSESFIDSGQCWQFLGLCRCITSPVLL
jgi:xanthine dehydrogenase molybdopterin-binding subunit B